jgi:hypothetical protein
MGSVSGLTAGKALDSSNFSLKKRMDPAGAYGSGGDSVSNALGAKKVNKALGIGQTPDVPDVVTSDPEAEAAAAKVAADKTKNASAAERRRRAKGSSLLASGGEKGVSGSSLLSQGSTTLGG